MESEQTLQPPAETTENPIMKHIAVKETGDSVNHSQNEEIKTEEAGNSTNSQIIDRLETLANSVDECDETLGGPIDDDLEPEHRRPETPNHNFHEIVPDSVGGSLSINPDVDLEAGQDPLQSPRWRSTYPMMEAIDCIVAILAFVLEVAQIMSNDNKPLKWVVLGFTVMSCLITWTMFALTARQTNARFSFGCFFLPDGQIYGSICKYIESYAAIIQVILSIISIIVKFPMRLTFGEIILSSTMISSKLTVRCTKSE